MNNYSKIWMAAGRVRGRYPRVSGLVSSFDPRICGFGYPKYFGFGADFRIDPRSSIGGPKRFSPIEAHLKP